MNVTAEYFTELDAERQQQAKIHPAAARNFAIAMVTQATRDAERSDDEEAWEALGWLEDTGIPWIQTLNLGIDTEKLQRWIEGESTLRCLRARIDANLTNLNREMHEGEARCQ